MDRFTFIMEYAGGTYLSQVYALSFQEAPHVWAKHLDVNGIPGVGMASKQKLIDELDPWDLVPIEGLDEVWCFSVLIRGKLALIHVVRTWQLSANENHTLGG